MQTILKENQKYITETWEKIAAKVSETSKRIQDGMPYTTRNGVYDDWQDADTAWWTNSFWSGILWHMYKSTGLKRLNNMRQALRPSWTRSFTAMMSCITMWDSCGC